MRGDERAKAEATKKFAEIGAAYEMLTEEHEKMEQAKKEAEEMNRRQARGEGGYHRSSGFGHSSDPFMDPFFQQHRSQFQHRDPFQIFEEVFFGGPRQSHQNQYDQQRGMYENDPFSNDPFFGGMGMGMNSNISAFGMMDQIGELGKI